jgi:hypothetical protein
MLQVISEPGVYRSLPVCHKLGPAPMQIVNDDEYLLLSKEAPNATIRYAAEVALPPPGLSEHFVPEPRVPALPAKPAAWGVVAVAGASFLFLLLWRLRGRWRPWVIRRFCAHSIAAGPALPRYYSRHDSIV